MEENMGKRAIRCLKMAWTLRYKNFDANLCLLDRRTMFLFRRLPGVKYIGINHHYDTRKIHGAFTQSITAVTTLVWRTKGRCPRRRIEILAKSILGDGREKCSNAFDIQQTSWIRSTQAFLKYVWLYRRTKSNPVRTNRSPDFKACGTASAKSLTSLKIICLAPSNSSFIPPLPDPITGVPSRRASWAVRLHPSAIVDIASIKLQALSNIRYSRLLRFTYRTDKPGARFSQPVIIRL